MQVDANQQQSDDEMPTLMDIVPSQTLPKIPGTEDMVPVIRDLSNAIVSLSSATDIHMQAADSVLGKRLAEEEVQGSQLELTLALNYANQDRGTPKKGRVSIPSRHGEYQEGSKQGHGQVVGHGEEGMKKLRQQPDLGLPVP